MSYVSFNFPAFLREIGISKQDLKPESKTISVPYFNIGPWSVPIDIAMAIVRL